MIYGKRANLTKKRDDEMMMKKKAMRRDDENTSFTYIHTFLSIGASSVKL